MQSEITLLFKKTLLVIFLFLISAGTMAQTQKTVTGTIQSAAGTPVASASVKLISALDSIVVGTNTTGSFNLQQVRAQSFTLTVTSLGFDTVRRNFSFESGKATLDVGPLVMRESNLLLEEVAITGRATVTVKEDTLEYNARNLKLREGALVEDALKRLDGVEVDRDGNVTAQGEAVTRARINGKDFFGGDIKTAIANLPADIVERIQIIDDYGDMANITGNRTGDPERVLNLEIAPGRNNGDFGNYRVGAGTEERYQVTAMYSRFKEGIQFSALGNLNNTNASLFDFNTRSGGARRGSGGGSFGRGGWGGGGGWGGANNGLTQVGSIGLNYRQDVNERLTMYGDYSFGHNDNTTLSTTLREEEVTNGRYFTDSEADNGSIGRDHRFSWNIEYKPDAVNYIKLSPNISIRDNRSDNFSRSTNLQNNSPINDLTNIQRNNSFSPNFGGSGLYNRRLSEHGRNVFVDFSLRTASTIQDQERILRTLMYETALEDLDSVYQQHLVDLENKNLNGGASLSYTEPLGQYTNLELNYDFNFSNYGNYRKANAYDALGNMIDNPEFNNERNYDYTFATHRMGLTYRYRTEKMNYSIGAAVQPNTLNGDAMIDGNNIRIDRKGLNFMPVARFEYKFSRSASFNINYSGRSSEPSFTQIQPFTDYSNVNAPVTGNPDLNAEFSHELRINYRNFAASSGNSIFAGITGSATEDRIVVNRNTFIDDSLGLVQETRYLNTDGFYNTRAYYNFSKPFSNRTYVVSLNGMASFNNNVSYTNDVRNIAKNWVLSQGLNFRYNPKETIELSPGVRYTYNTTNNSISSTSNRDVSTWAATFSSTINLTPTWVWGTELAKTSNNGYNAAVDANPMIIDTYIEKQFFKGRNGAIRLHAFDLLNEQVNVSRSVTENIILDSRTNRLARYFMLTLSYRFQNFAGGSMDSPGGWGGGGDHRGGGRF